MPALMRAEVSTPFRFSAVNSTAKKITHTTYGTAGKKLMAARLHQMVQMSGLST